MVSIQVVSRIGVCMSVSLPPQMLRRRRRTARSGAMVFSVAAHVLVLTALLSARSSAPIPPETAPMTVALIPGAPEMTEAAPSAPAQSSAAPRPQTATPLKPHPTPVRPDAPKAPVEPASPAPPELTEAQLAGAATADGGLGDGGSGTGEGGGPCNMARRLQGALRKDPLVQAAARNSGAKALMVWNGDWVQGSGEDGKGMAAVREAIMWEVAFAPAACRTEPVHGLVLISLNDAPGAARLVVGTPGWRWSDLLGMHGAR